jgi:hypothetical protein
LAFQRVKKTRVPNAKRYEIYHIELMPEFLIADTKSEAVDLKRALERKHGGQARIIDLKTDPHNGG